MLALDDLKLTLGEFKMIAIPNRDHLLTRRMPQRGDSSPASIRTT
jgi:hypothetical protein